MTHPIDDLADFEDNLVELFEKDKIPSILIDVKLAHKLFFKHHCTAKQAYSILIESVLEQRQYLYNQKYLKKPRPKDDDDDSWLESWL